MWDRWCGIAGVVAAIVGLTGCASGLPVNADASSSSQSLPLGPSTGPAPYSDGTERAATYDDYLWTENGGTAGEFQAFSLALIQEADIEEVTTQLPVIDDLGVLGYQELEIRSYDDWNPEQLLVGLVQIGSWAAMFEVNGFAGVTGSLMIPLSKGRQVVSHHYSDGNGHGSFHLYEDGRLSANFEPLFGPGDVQADDPDRLIVLMRESGFDQGSKDHVLEGKQHNRAAAFALMERLTGVQLDPGTIANATFSVVRVQMPRS